MTKKIFLAIPFAAAIAACSNPEETTVTTSAGDLWRQPGLNRHLSHSQQSDDPGAKRQSLPC